jgi:hypothetical protein
MIRRPQKIPPLAACVNTLPEAVALSLKDGLTENCLFKFARALKAFETTNSIRLQSAERENAFTLWWNKAKPLFPADADFDQWRLDFLNSCAKAKVPLGANSLQAAICLADSKSPPEAGRYGSPKVRRLVAVCSHLQVLAGQNPFFLSVRSVAHIIWTKNLRHASAMLGGLVQDRILIEVTKGTPGGKRATRFRFNLAPSGPAKETRTNAK